MRGSFWRGVETQVQPFVLAGCLSLDSNTPLFLKRSPEFSSIKRTPESNTRSVVDLAKDPEQDFAASEQPDL